MKGKLRTTRVPSAVATAMALVLVACSGSSTDKAAHAPPGPATASTEAAADELRIVTSFAVKDLDPATGRAFYAGFLETLMRTNSKGEVSPALLQTLEPLGPDAWKLTLRSGITFQNAKPVDAAALVAAMARQHAQRKGLADQLPGATFEATGPLEVTMRTGGPSPQVPFLLADDVLFPVYDVAVVEGAADKAQAIAGKGAFTGPYAVSRLTETAMDLDRHDGYWQGKPALARVRFTFNDDAQARLAAVRAGEADIAERMNVPEVKRAAEAEGLTFAQGSAPFDAMRLYFNVATAPFDDVAVRRATLAALDYDAIAEEFLEGTYDPATGLFPAVFPAAKKNLAFDLDGARQLLDAAGWAEGDDGRRSKGSQQLEMDLLLYTGRPEMQTAAVAMQDQLKAIGMSVTVISQEYDDAMYADLSRWDAALYVDYSLSSTGAPDTYMASYLKSGEDGFQNFGKIADAELDGLLDQLAVAPDAPTRAQLLDRVQQLVITERAYVGVVGFKRNAAVASPAWKSYVPDDDSYRYVSVTHATRPG